MEREINEVMRGCYTRSNSVSRKSSEKGVATENREKLKQKEIEDDDVCPICQDEFLQQPEPLTYCKYVTMMSAYHHSLVLTLSLLTVPSPKIDKFSKITNWVK